MKRFVLLCVMTVIMPVWASAATIKNLDSKIQSVVVAEGSSRRDAAIKTDSQIDICPKGCFVTFPNGDRFALQGNEVIEINGGRANFH